MSDKKASTRADEESPGDEQEQGLLSGKNDDEMGSDNAKKASLAPSTVPPPTPTPTSVFEFIFCAASLQV